MLSVSAGSQPIVGFNYGAGRFDRVKKIYKTMMAAETVIGVIGMLAFEFFPLQIISIFGSENALYNQFAVFAFRVYLSTIILCCIQKSTSVFLQSLGKTVSAFTLSMIRDIVVNIGVVLILPHFIGLTGTMLSAPIADAVSFILVLFMMRRVFHSFNEKYTFVPTADVKTA